MNSQAELPPEIAALPRQQRRYWMRQQVKANARQAPRRTRPRRHRRIDLLAPFFPIARAMLMTGEKATAPKFRAILKMAKYLIASPGHHYLKRHQRGSWRLWSRRIGQDELKQMETK